MQNNYHQNFENETPQVQIRTQHHRFLHRNRPNSNFQHPKNRTKPPQTTPTTTRFLLKGQNYAEVYGGPEVSCKNFI